MNQKPRFAWMNDKVLPWEDCTLHGRTQGAFWGANVFEGVRAYWHEAHGQLSIFRLEPHLRRLAASAKCLRMALPYTDEALTDACISLLTANAFRQDVHIVILAYFGVGENFDSLGLTDDVGMHITALPMPRSPRFAGGASVCVSSWRRIGDDTMPPRIKTGANYHNSRLAHQEAIRGGYDSALFLNQRGTIAEAPGCCVAMIRNGAIHTPPGTSGVLEGITLSTVVALASAELGIPTVEREIDRTELYLADELFLCGTLAEIQPVTSIDGVPIGNGRPGPVTQRLQAVFDRHVREGARPEWCLPVEAASQQRWTAAR